MTIARLLHMPFKNFLLQWKNGQALPWQAQNYAAGMIETISLKLA
jgi:hypothetical protein